MFACVCEISQVRKFSHHCSWARNFRNTIHGCEIFAPCVLFSSFVPLTSDDHNLFIQTPFEVFLDSMESPLSQESRFMPVEDKWGSKPC